ncbi:aldose epimerase family protein [Flavobacterium wongokense]|uniref:aldose epimerase family protein n=1 Tax=Flavobacterium wongokense TaxID=2910674 RepID=UPI001F4582E5|nr:aldose epimerase family protein [Flavobacterium sp. WG47]MCF6130956.1 galactose mutarotase [Flavobacterium sp. WG47]
MDKNHFSQIDTTKNVKSFGFLADGKEVLCFTLNNKAGCEFSVINYGATLTSLKIPVYDNKKTDIVLGFETLDDYINSYYLPSPPYFGTVVGRYAGRISNAEFSLNGKRIFLNKNHGEHSIHGGILGFSRKFWKLISFSSEENPSITLEYVSKDGEENFPGELTVRVTYTLTEENELQVSFSAKSSEETILNLTQHTYFNLDGHSKDIANQKLSVNSNKILETTEELIPTGEFASLKNHLFDFSSAKFCPVSIDNTFVLDDRIAATLISEKNKLKMTITTNQPAVHIYVGGNCFGRIKGKENTDYHTTSGICFEAQNFPDAPNHNHFPSATLKKDEEYNHQTTFKFENI